MIASLTMKQISSSPYWLSSEKVRPTIDDDFLRGASILPGAETSQK